MSVPNVFLTKVKTLDHRVDCKPSSAIMGMPTAAGTYRWEEAGRATLPPYLDSSWNLRIGSLIFSAEKVVFRYQRGRDEPLGTLVGQSYAVSLSCLVGVDKLFRVQHPSKSHTCTSEYKEISL